MGHGDRHRWHDKKKFLSFLFLPALSVSLFLPPICVFFSSLLNRADPLISTQFVTKIHAIDTWYPMLSFAVSVVFLGIRKVTQWIRITNIVCMMRSGCEGKRSERMRHRRILSLWPRSNLFTWYRSLDRKKAVYTRHQGILMTNHNNFIRSKNFQQVNPSRLYFQAIAVLTLTTNYI